MRLFLRDSFLLAAVGAGLLLTSSLQEGTWSGVCPAWAALCGGVDPPDRTGRPSMPRSRQGTTCPNPRSYVAADGQGQQKIHLKKALGKAAETDYYKLLSFTPPPGEVLEAGALEVLPDGKVAVGTRRGEIWLIENAYADDPEKVKFRRFAHGLHEVLGLAAKDGWLYVTQRPDVTRIKDSNGDGKADVFEVGQQRRGHRGHQVHHAL